MELKLEEYVEITEFDPYWIYLIVIDNIEIGRITLRSGDDINHMYDGHIGYGIEKEYRGHNYSYLACLLLKDIMINKGYDHVILTCDPNNIASRKIIEKLGALFLEKRTIPKQLRKYYPNNEKERLIYKWRLK